MTVLYTCTRSYVIIMMLLMGVTGMTYGLFLSSRVEDETEAVQASLGSFYPILFLSGVMWPIQGLIYFLLAQSTSPIPFLHHFRHTHPAPVVVLPIPDLLGL